MNRAPARLKQPSVVPLLLFLGLVVLGMALTVRGYEFYQLDLDQRVEHDDYRVLSPTGVVGQGYGVFAALLILLNLSYLVRRRFPRAPLGSMSAWLHGHVFTGLAAALLAAFHSAFQARSDLATMLLIALTIVIVTGVLGRFLRWLSAEVDEEQLQVAYEALEEVQPGLGQRIEGVVLSHPIPPEPLGTSVLAALKALPQFLRVARQRRTAVHRAAALSLEDPDLRHLGRRIVRQTASLAAGQARSRGLTRLMSSWRALHRFFAILMVVAVLLHAGVAWYYGYRWIFE